MAYNENLADRIREVLAHRSDLTEKKMFGGLSFMLGGNMCCGVVGEDLMIRVGADQYEDTLSLPHARPMDFTGRPMKGFVFVESEGLDSDVHLQEWIDRGLEFISTLPPK